MKRFLTLITGLALIVSTATAQTSGSGIMRSTPTHVPTDTVVNTATKTQSLAISVANDVVSVQTDVTKISGTAGGVVTLWASNTGNNYVRIPTIKTDGSSGLDSLSVGNVSAVQSKIFRVASPSYSFYQIRYTGTGTMSAKLNSLAIWRRQ
jgi:hypothetical protein